MKSYPSIEYYGKYWGEKVWAFDKLDGSNIRCEWSRKNGWYKFGSRNCLINEKNQQFGGAIKLFKEKYGEGLDDIFRKHKDYRNAQSMVCFSEYYSENSFAGRQIDDEVKDIMLFDISMYKKGWVAPKDFIEDFQELGIPKIIYTGNLNKEFVREVKENKFGLKEGVVAKGVRQTKGDNLIWMLKIKTNDWLDRLKNKFGEDALKEERAPEEVST